jgi:flagellar biosynthesis protein
MSEYKDILRKKAVALRYDINDVAPIIVASGMGHMAEKIVEIAVENDVPVYEDNSLATILTQLELGAEIPQELYKAIVEIYVFFLKYSQGNTQKAQEQPHQNEEVLEEEQN